MLRTKSIITRALCSSRLPAITVPQSNRDAAPPSKKDPRADVNYGSNGASSLSTEFWQDKSRALNFHLTTVVVLTAYVCTYRYSSTYTTTAILRPFKISMIELLDTENSLFTFSSFNRRSAPHGNHSGGGLAASRRAFEPHGSQLILERRIIREDAQAVLGSQDVPSQRQVASDDY